MRKSKFNLLLKYLQDNSIIIELLFAVSLFFIIAVNSYYFLGNKLSIIFISYLIIYTFYRSLFGLFFNTLSLGLKINLYPAIAISSFLLTIVISKWPGLFQNDSLGTLETVKSLNISNWYGLMSPILFIGQYYVFPHEFSLVVPNLVVFALSTYICCIYIQKSIKSWKISFIIISFLFVVFTMSVPLINHLLLAGHYTSLFGFLSLLIGVSIFTLLGSNEEFNYKPWLYVSVLSALSMGLRYEGVLNVLITTLAIVLYIKKNFELSSKTNNVFKICFVLSPSLISVILIFLVNFVPYFDQKKNNHYEVLPLAGIAAYILKQPDWISPDKKKTLESIGRFIDIKYITETQHGHTEPNYFFHKRNLQATNEDKRSFISGVFELILWNPAHFMNSRLLLAFATSGMHQDGGWFYYDGIRLMNDPRIKELRDNYLRRPLPTLEAWLDQQMVSAAQYKGVSTTGSFISHNWVLFLILFIIPIVFIKRNNIEFVFLVMVLIAKIPVNLIFMPTSHSMHYLTIYAGWTIVLCLAVSHSLRGYHGSARMRTKA
ncbi:hypothetical protein [Candidatus Thiosymbion oneisti]|uniref:hypothetical protein n=1 Tax=Candidatus Thiosymbion oneisti TaxID=589554 RepID=UPI00114CF262|nr:hypothetical protein [Candidatus Thiosymbion oneisti]